MLGRHGEERRPIPRATVLVRRARANAAPAPPPTVTLADDVGLASVDAIPPGEWTVRAVAEGYVSAEVERSPSPDSSGTVGTIELDALGSVDAGVVTPSGTPAVGTELEIYYPSGARAWGRGLHPSDAQRLRSGTAPADDRGVVRRFPVVPRLPLRAVFRLRGSGRAELDLDPLAPGECRALSVVLDAPTGIVGRAPDGPGVVSRREVLLSSVVDGGRGLDEEARTTPGSDGSFAFDEISPGPKLLQLVQHEPGSVAVGFLEATATAGRVVDAGTILILPSATTLLALVDTERPEERIVRVCGSLVVSGTVPRQFPISVRFGAGTAFLLRGVPSGMLTLNASVQRTDLPLPDPSFRDRTTRLAFDGTPREIVFELVRAPDEAPVRVRVIPPPGVTARDLDARVAVTRADRVVRGSPEAWPGQDEFRFRLAPGSYGLIAVANGWTAGPTTVSVATNEARDWVIDSWREGRPARGRVVDAQGVPIPRAAVHISAGEEDPALEPLLLEWTDDAGGFAMKALPPVNPLTLQAYSPGWMSEPRTIDGRLADEPWLEVRLTRRR